MNPSAIPDQGDEPTDFVSVLAAIIGRHGDEVAVADLQQRVTYRELDAWSELIASHLFDAVGAGEEPVLVLSGHDVPAVAAFIAVAKCARPVVMLDSTTPVARMQGIAERAAPVAILYLPELGDLADLVGTVAGVALPLPPRPDQPTTAFDRIQLPDGAPLSIVFTSGSTGKPKGVIIGSTAFMAVVLAAGLSEGGDRILCPAPLGFVFGLGLMIRALTTGNALHLHDPRATGVDSLAARIDSEQITELGCNPFVIRSLASVVGRDRVFSSINVVMLGGEAVLTRDISTVRSFTRPDVYITNQLGSTESWGISNLVILPGSALPDQNFLSVGSPSAGREVHLVGENGEVVTGPGASGVIHVVGEHMSAGYWRDPVSTAARFSRLPDGRRSYITGDIGRWNDEGQLEYLGRADNMVKIRGYLVEPAEVESHIRDQGEVDDCVVVGRPSPRDDGTINLLAYVVPTLNAWTSGAAIRRRLAADLPTYMVPALVIELTELPRNPNGKVDRLRLPEPPVIPAPAPAFKYEYEEAIADVAAMALGLDVIGVDDDLFELGLDSLAVEEMVAVLEEQLGLTITSTSIMENPTAAKLARLPGGDASHLVDGILTALAEGAGAPVFAISGAGGLALQLRELAQQLHLDRPVYGIQGYGLEGTGFPDWTVSRMARRTLRTMRRLQPQGPYTLLGHSLGSLIAFDIARRLVRSGEAVAYLGLLDPPDAKMLVQSAALSDLMPITRDTSSDSALWRARAAVATRYPFTKRSFWRGARGRGRFRAWFEAGGSAAQRYRLRRPLRLDGAYIYLAEGIARTAAERWFTSAPTVAPASGDHLSMLRRPFVSQLAADVARDIARANPHVESVNDHTIQMDIGAR